MGIKLGLNNIIFLSYSLLIACCYLLPQLQYFVRVQELAILTLIFFMLFSIKEIGIKSISILKWNIPFILIFFIVSKNFDWKYGLFHPFLMLWVTIFPAFLYKTIESRGLKFEKYFLLISILILASSVMLNTISMMEENPTIARAMTSGLTDEDYVTEMKLMGVGGYGISYSSGLLALCTITTFLNTSNLLTKIFSAFFSLLFLYMAFNAQFTTLIIITITCIGVLLFYSSKNILHKWIYFILFIIFFFITPTILQELIIIYGDSPVSQHLIELYNKLTGTGAIVETQRNAYQSNCLSLMFESPIWGHNVDGEYHYLFTHSHSTILGYGLATGVVGVFFYMATLIKTFKLSVSNIGEKLLNKFFFPIILYYILLSYFNPTNSLEINFVFFLVIPLIYNCSSLKNIIKS